MKWDKLNNVRLFLDELSNNFPIDFKKEIAKNSIKSLPEIVDHFNIIFAITHLIDINYIWKHSHIHNGIICLEYIKKFYGDLGFNINSYLIEYSGFAISQIKINDKNIEINNLIDVCPIKGTIGVNIFNAIFEHVIRLLLGIDSLYLYNESIS
jgi:hypothetical protein